MNLMGSSTAFKPKILVLHSVVKGKLSLAERIVTRYPELLFEEGLVMASSGLRV